MREVRVELQKDNILVYVSKEEASIFYSDGKIKSIPVIDKKKIYQLFEEKRVINV